MARLEGTEPPVDGLELRPVDGDGRENSPPRPTASPLRSFGIFDAPLDARWRRGPARGTVG